MVDQMEKGRTLNMKSRLIDAAEKAHKLTEALRAKGVQAYEFHDRASSIVTIGSFDSVGTPQPNGQIELNPQIHAIMQKYGAENHSLRGRHPRSAKPRARPAFRSTCSLCRSRRRSVDHRRLCPQLRHALEMGPFEPPSWLATLALRPRRQNIAGGRFLFEMQLDTASVELTEHLFNPVVDGRMVGAVAGDELFDDCPQHGGFEQLVGEPAWNDSKEKKRDAAAQ